MNNYKLKKKLSGGVIICDIINNENIIVLGKSNILNEIDTFESFGGKAEKTDLSPLHTAIRELIEEFFNFKISDANINDIVIKLEKEKQIIKRFKHSGMIYLINFTGLNIISKLLSQYLIELNDYIIDGIFNINDYIINRIIDDKPINGLNEIKLIKIFNLNDVINNKINLRLYTKMIINTFLINNFHIVV
jgi:hypothetical protein